ncbi:MAG: nucleotidyltransferase domain-containing protein [Candidatus Shapirobacteria bacterium]|jgi:predicted nucleotidyltransferase
MERLEKVVAISKKYALKYGQKLDSTQLFLRLISGKVYSEKTIKKYGEKRVKNLINERKIELAEELVKKHLIKIKGIEMVGITGSVAAEAAKKNEDIDLLIITKADELWWNRLYLRIYVLINQIPHRVFGKKEKENEFCFNLWLDENALEIPKSKRNLKNAMDLIMMKVIFDKDNSYQRFLAANKWVKEYLATGYEYRKNGKKPKFQKQNKSEIKKIINRILFWGQYLYMRTKSKKILVNLGQAFFHEDN